MSRSKIVLVTMLMAGVLGAGLVVAQTYPHAFPREGVKKMFENDEVAIWDVTWPIGIPQPYHRHQYDMAGVYLRYGQIHVTKTDGTLNPPRDKPFEVPRLLFQAKDVTHKEEGFGKLGDPEQWSIMTDLKGYSPVYGPAPAGVSPAFPREGAKSEIDNERATFWDYTWELKKPTGMHYHALDAIEVIVDGGTLRTTTQDGKASTRTVKRGDARFVAGNHTDSEEAISGSPRAITIELKPRS